jgi:hypothetical protein
VHRATEPSSSSDEQMKVLRHDDLSQHNKAVLFTHFVENSQKQITPLVGVEPRFSLIATAGNEVQISSAAATPQTLGHEARLNPVRWDTYQAASNSRFRVKDGARTRRRNQKSRHTTTCRKNCRCHPGTSHRAEPIHWHRQNRAEQSLYGSWDPIQKSCPCCWHRRSIWSQSVCRFCLAGHRPRDFRRPAAL